METPSLKMFKKGADVALWDIFNVHGGTWLKVGLDDFGGLCQPWWFYDYILWKVSFISHTVFYILDMIKMHEKGKQCVFF